MNDHARALIDHGERFVFVNDVERNVFGVSWWVTPPAYEAGLYTATSEALRCWIGNELPFTAPFYSNAEIPR
jgi:hypothetical protein